MPTTDSADSGQDDNAGIPSLDLAYLRDLLGLLKDMGVAGFTAGGLAVSFRNDEPGEAHVPFVGRAKKQVIEDEDRSTSSQAVRGFEPRDGFKNPALWPGQLGKTLRFDGTFE